MPDGKGIPLISFVEKEGIKGCYTYWVSTLNEETVDFTMYLNEKRGFSMESYDEGTGAAKYSFRK